MTRRGDKWREFVDKVGVTQITRTNGDGVRYHSYEVFDANHPHYALVKFAFDTGYDGGVVNMEDC